MSALVRDIMMKDPKTIRSMATIGEAVEIFAKEGIGSLIVIDEENHLTGFLSDGDIIDYVVRNVKKKNQQLNHIRSWYQIDCFQQYLKNVVNDPVYNCYTEHAYTVEANDTVREASRLIQRKHLKHVPVIDEGKVVGLLTRNLVIRGLFHDYITNPDAECIESGQDDDF